MPRPGTRIVTVDPPQEEGRHDGLAYALFLPPPQRPPTGGVVVLHGADSSKESHQDFARACRTVGIAALCFDQRGHGESEGALDGGAIADVGEMAELLRARVAALCPAAPVPLPLALRGSSMGGYLAIVAAEQADAEVVVAICPASGDGLRRGIESDRFAFRRSPVGLVALLDQHDVSLAATAVGERLFLLHAEGDESVPVQHSRELHARAPGSRLLVTPGGHHRSIQHDAELQGVVLRHLQKRFAAAAPGQPGSRSSA